MTQKQIFKPFKPVPHLTYTFKEIFENYELTSINDLGIDYHDSHDGTTIYTISVQKRFRPYAIYSNNRSQYAYRLHIRRWRANLVFSEIINK